MNRPYHCVLLKDTWTGCCICVYLLCRPGRVQDNLMKPHLTSLDQITHTHKYQTSEINKNALKNPHRALMTLSKMKTEV